MEVTGAYLGVVTSLVPEAMVAAISLPALMVMA